MIDISTLFSDHPKTKMDLYQKSESVSKKSETLVKTANLINVFLQNDKANLISGITPGTTYTAYISTSIIPGIAIDFGDELEAGGYRYNVIGVLLQDESPDYHPFWKLNLERRKIAA